MILFHFLKRLLTSNHLKLFSTYLVGRNGALWETCFSALHNAKKKITWNLESKCLTDFFLELGLRLWRIIHVITGWAHKSQKCTLISLKIMRIWNFFTRKRVFKNKEVVSKLHVCTNDFGKMFASYIFHFSTRILNLTHMK